MLCPESAQCEPDKVEREDDEISGNVPKKLSQSTPKNEGASGFDMSSFKNLKTWKKSISKFFRNQLRSTKSNDGDLPSGSKDNFEDTEICSEQKWQSLGKIFRRQSFAEHWPKSASHQEETASQNKRLAVRRVLSSYFGKSKQSISNDE